MADGERGWEAEEARAGVATVLGDTAVDAAAFDALVALLEASGVGMLLFDASGGVTRTTAGALGLARDDPEGVEVLDAARRLAHVCLTAAPAGGTGPGPARVVRRLLATRRSDYHLIGALVSSALDGVGSDRASVAVTVERAAWGGGALSDEDLRARFGLSGREAQVARLTAEGRSTPQVGVALGISAHTARHHLERVFTKLGVSTRGALQARVLGGRGAAGA